MGGKTGVNHPRGKNMIGAFYQPRCVLIDTDSLNTLPDRELASGISGGWGGCAGSGGWVGGWWGGRRRGWLGSNSLLDLALAWGISGQPAQPCAAVVGQFLSSPCTHTCVINVLDPPH